MGGRATAASRELAVNLLGPKGLEIMVTGTYQNEYRFFGRLEAAIMSSVLAFGGPTKGTLLRLSVDIPIHGSPGHSIRITREFLKPIQLSTPSSGYIPAHIVDVEKKP